MRSAAEGPDRAFRELSESWIGASPSLGRLLRKRLSPGIWIHDLPDPGPSPENPGLPARGQLTLAAFTGSGTVVLNAAEDPGWEMRSAELTDIRRLRLDTAAFTGSHALTLDSDALAIS